MRAKKRYLSKLNQDCLNEAREHGGLVRFHGPIWSKRNPKTLELVRGGRKMPEVHFYSRTVEVLIKLGLFEVVEKTQCGKHPKVVKVKGNKERS